MGKGKRKRLKKIAIEREILQSKNTNAPETISESRCSSIRLDVIICAVFALITFTVYGQVINHEFIDFDDDKYVTDNDHVQSGLNPKSISWSFSFSDKNQIYWHPLTWISHMSDCQLYGLNPGMHHLTNLVIHLVNTVLLFLLFRWMTGAIWKSVFVAALFTIHPINVDSVAWVAERKNLLSSFFWLLTMLSYIKYCAQPRLSSYLLTFSAFALGLLAKPMLVTLPFVLLLLDYWPLERLRPITASSIFRLVKEKIPFLILSAASVYLSISSLKGYNVAVSFEQVPLTLRISNALVSYVSYIGKMVWPQNLGIFYPYPSTIPFWKIACSSLFLILSSLVVVLAGKRKPYLLVGWFWFLGTLVPVIGLIQAGLFPSMADRWAYVPFIGLFIMIGWGVPDLLARWKHKKTGLAISGAAVLTIFTMVTLMQLGYWKNSVTLYEHTLQVTSNNVVIHTNQGIILAKQGKLPAASRHFSEALRINPYYDKALNSLGFVRMKQGKLDEASRHFSEAVWSNPNNAIAQNNLGFVLLKQGKLEEAIRHLSEALRIDPFFGRARNNLNAALAEYDKITGAAVN